jgi:uncharacterized membrane protein
MFRNGLQPAHIIMIFLVVLPVILIIVGIVLLAHHLQKRRQATSPQIGSQEWPAAPPAATGPDPIEQVRRLAELRDSGAITDEEYQARKNKLLGDVP